MIPFLAQLTEPDAIDQFPTPYIDWAALAPILILAVGALLLLTVDSLLRVRRPAGIYALWTVLVACGAGLSTINLWERVLDGNGPFSAVGLAIGIDGFSLFLTGVICTSVVLTTLAGDSWARRERIEGPTFYVLVLLSATGGVIMAMANDLIVLFLGLETLSIAAYLLAALHLRRIQSQEAGLKYFVLGAFSSAFLLYGMAMIYGATGTTNLVEIKLFFTSSLLHDNGLLLLGLALMLVGFGFKVGAVPFHTWVPDVYDGSPSPVVAFMASGVKAAGFAALIRVYVLTFGDYGADWQPMVYALAVLTLFGGAVLAVVQTNVKRMLAYSSIAHAGFMLIAVQLATPAATSSLLFYLATYTFLVAGTFTVITIVDGEGDGGHQLSDYRGLGQRHPALAFTFTVFLLAQAGVPATSGFFAKFNVIAAAEAEESYVLAVLAMVSAVIAAYIYLRLVATMFMASDASVDGDADAGSDFGIAGEVPLSDLPRPTVPFLAGIALVVCLLVTIGVGLFPDPLADLADDSTPELVCSTDGTGCLPPEVTAEPLGF